MTVAQILPLVGGISGLIGGAVAVLNWAGNRKKDGRTFNQLTYNNHIKHSYKKCFENTKCPETDHVNIYYLWDVIDNFREFKKHDNSFKGSANSKFKDAFLYADVIKFDHWTALNWFNGDTEVNNQSTIDDYNEKKVHIQRLKPFFKDFYLSVFENID